jgi:hypothetical protein
MASYLNLSLLKLNPSLPINELYLQPILNTHLLIKKSNVVQQILNSGYSFVNYSMFTINNENSFYLNFDDPESLNAILQTTIWHALISKIQEHYYPNQRNPLIYPNLKIFQRLIDSIPNNRIVPTFVYAHIMMPHDPFEYDENGNRMSAKYRNLLDNRSYLRQLRYTNTLVINTIKNILFSEKKKPIIIIQGDHGYRYLKNVDLKNKRNEAHSIFSSYLYPQDIRSQLNDSIRPIDAISLLFNNH